MRSKAYMADTTQSLLDSSFAPQLTTPRFARRLSRRRVRRLPQEDPGPPNLHPPLRLQHSRVSLPSHPRFLKRRQPFRLSTKILLLLHQRNVALRLRLSLLNSSNILHKVPLDVLRVDFPPSYIFSVERGEQRRREETGYPQGGGECKGHEDI